MTVDTKTGPPPRTLETERLHQRLRQLVGHERNVQVEFLLHLAELDARKGYAEAGYDSLWNYCLRELHLREGPTARRIAAMRVLTRYPSLEAPLRDGRLCMSTITLVAPLLEEMAIDDVVARAAHLTKAGVEQLVVSLRPREAPRDGVRKVVPAGSAAANAPQRVGEGAVVAGGAPVTRGRAHLAQTALVGAPPERWAVDLFARGAAPLSPLSTPRPQATASNVAMFHGEDGASNVDLNLSSRAAPNGDPNFRPRSDPNDDSNLSVPAASNGACCFSVPAAANDDFSASAPRSDAGPSQARAVPASSARRAELSPMSAAQWSLRVTMDASMKADLETLQSLLSHKAGRDLAEVVREALRCAVEKHGKRRGAVAPTRVRRPAARDGQSVARAPADEASIPGAEHRASKATPAGAPRATTPRATRPPPAPRARPAQAAAACTATLSVAGDSPDQKAETTGGHPAPAQAAAAQAGTRESAPVNENPRAISAQLRRAVWARDEHCCAWVNKDGRRCGSRWKLEIDHIKPVALQGRPTLDNLRLLCRTHNIAHAEQIFGRRHMARFRDRAASRPRPLDDRLSAAVRASPDAGGSRSRWESPRPAPGG